MSAPGSSIVIGLAGGTGSGKTTVAQVILEQVGRERIAYVPHDAYYRSLADLPPAQRDAINWDHPDALDTELMIEQVQALKSGRVVILTGSMPSTTAKEDGPVLDKVRDSFRWDK